MRARGERRCALYRHYDERGRLLYLGISDRLSDRSSEHAKRSEWAQFAHTGMTEWFASRKLALDAEREAIEREQPIFNSALAPQGREQRVESYLAARRADGLPIEQREAPLPPVIVVPSSGPLDGADQAVYFNGGHLDGLTATVAQIKSWPVSARIYDYDWTEQCWTSEDAVPVRVWAFRSPVVA